VRSPDRSRSPLRLATAPGADLAAAVDAFLSQPDLAAGTRAKYRQTLTVVEGELGDARVTGAALAAVIAQRWHHASPATWNRQLATVHSFARYCTRTRGLGGRRRDRAAAAQREARRHPQHPAREPADGTALLAAIEEPLAPNDTNKKFDCYVVAMATGQATLVSGDASGASIHTGSNWCAISPNGHLIAFSTQAKLTSDVTGQKVHLYLRDLLSGALRLLTAPGQTGASTIPIRLQRGRQDARFRNLDGQRGAVARVPALATTARVGRPLLAAESHTSGALPRRHAAQTAALLVSPGTGGSRSRPSRVLVSTRREVHRASSDRPPASRPIAG
jgi:hypothetical protein